MDTKSAHKSVLLFIVALSMVAKKWNYMRVTSIDALIMRTMWIYKMKKLYTLKVNEIVSFTGKWMKIEDNMLSKIR